MGLVARARCQCLKPCLSSSVDIRDLSLLLSACLRPPRVAPTATGKAGTMAGRFLAVLMSSFPAFAQHTHSSHALSARMHIPAKAYHSQGTTNADQQLPPCPTRQTCQPGSNATLPPTTSTKEVIVSTSRGILLRTISTNTNLTTNASVERPFGHHGCGRSCEAPSRPGEAAILWFSGVYIASLPRRVPPIWLRRGADTAHQKAVLCGQRLEESRGPYFQNFKSDRPVATVLCLC